MFEPINRERYRNPPAPPEYRCSNAPDIVRKSSDNEKIEINFDELEELGMFNDPNVDIYDKFVINSDSEDDDIIEIPVEPIVKNIESICLSDDDDELTLIPLDNIKKEKEEIQTKNKTKDVENTEQRIDLSRSIEVKISEQKTVKKPPAKDDKEVKRGEEKQTELKIKATAVESTEQRIDRKRVDKVSEGVSAKRLDESKEKTLAKTEKYSEKKTKRDYEETRHKKIKHSDKSARKRSELPKDENSDFEETEERGNRRKVKKRSLSPLDEYMKPIKKENPSVHGVYHCEICNLTLNSHTTFESHITGKRHKKNLDAKNVAQAVAKSYVPTKPTNKCPKPPIGFHRVEINSLAIIQEVIDNKLRSPCPGLHKVTEIQSLSETSYYCSLCDAPCSANSILPHLNGFKHQLNCLKNYDNILYNELKTQDKHLVEGPLARNLKAIERKYGRGVLKVERDVPDDGTYDYHASIPSTSSRPPSFSGSSSFSRPSTSSRHSTSSRPSSSSRDQPSTSKQAEDFSDIYAKCSQPDPTKSGWYCKICDSHSNSKAMWDAHIGGKRHIANVKKAPGTAPSKSRNVPAPPGTIPRLDSLLADVYEPIVGLDQIREIRKLDIDLVSYTCFLCAGCIGEGEIVDHIVSRKHREKYLEKIEYPELETLRSCQMSDFALTSVIAEMCDKVEYERGRGRPEVYYAKNSLLKM